TLPWRGRVGSHGAQAECETGWGESLSTRRLIEWRDFHPTPLLIAFAATLPLQGRVGALQLPRIGKRERAHPPRVLVEDQAARDRRLGALAAVFALAEPAVDADRRALGLLEVHAGGIDEFRRMPDLAAETNRKARLRQRVRRHRPAHHLRDGEIARSIG